MIGRNPPFPARVFPKITRPRPVPAPPLLAGAVARGDADLVGMGMPAPLDFLRGAEEPSVPSTASTASACLARAAVRGLRCVASPVARRWGARLKAFRVPSHGPQVLDRSATRTSQPAPSGSEIEVNVLVAFSELTPSGGLCSREKQPSSGSELEVKVLLLVLLPAPAAVAVPSTAGKDSAKDVCTSWGRSSPAVNRRAFLNRNCPGGPGGGDMG
mmetsp:Transcript_93220/g.200017  ORF Transcript_93220/g.200017 Transcript_93220/m.200017 type:complete len:215 (+) Transcript_93220:149-793(+)